MRGAASAEGRSGQVEWRSGEVEKNVALAYQSLAVLVAHHVEQRVRLANVVDRTHVREAQPAERETDSCELFHCEAMRIRVIDRRSST